MMTIEEIRILVSNDEHRTLELKKSTSELKEGMQSLCAFLNCDGGYLIFGVAPKSLKLVGQMVSDSTRQAIANEIRKLEPYVDMCVQYVNLPNDDVNQLIVIQADKSKYTNAPYVYEGRPYYKLESTTMRMPQSLYEEMLRKRDAHKFSWDNQIAIGYAENGLDEARIRSVVKIGVRNGRLNAMAEEDDLHSLLAKLKLLKDDKVKNAAVALFAKDIDDYPQLELKMACFKGTTKDIFIDNKIANGNIFDLLEEGVAFCFRNLQLNGKVEGLLRQEELEIPMEALRESLINALCHRQYERTDGSISLAIYDDRLEIINPGLFPPEISVDTIKQPHESYPHNKLIAQVLYQTSFLEKWGTGAQRILSVCRVKGLPEPRWKVENGTVSIIFFRNTKSQSGSQSVGDNVGDNVGDANPMQLTERQRNILGIIKKNPAISGREMSEMLSVAQRTIERDLKKLNDAGLIHHEGEDNSGFWVVNNEN